MNSKNYYDSNLEFYNSALALFIKLIEPLANIEYVSGRIKDYDECLSKFERKYLPGIKTSDRDYKIFDYLSDFVGIRIICPYLKDINTVRKEFEKIFQRSFHNRLRPFRLKAPMINLATKVCIWILN